MINFVKIPCVFEKNVHFAIIACRGWYIYIYIYVKFVKCFCKSFTYLVNFFFFVFISYCERYVKIFYDCGFTYFFFRFCQFLLYMFCYYVKYMKCSIFPDKADLFIIMKWPFSLAIYYIITPFPALFFGNVFFFSPLLYKPFLSLYLRFIFCKQCIFRFLFYSF